MSTKVKLMVTRGSIQGTEYTYDQPDSLVVGRKNDCAIVLPEKTISRYHCIVDVNPPAVLVRDFGSLNGTFLNGKKVGQRDPDMSPDDAKDIIQNNFELHDGDTLGLGRDCEITVSITAPIHCNDCGCEIDDVQNKMEEISPDKYLCEKCSARAKKEAEEAQARAEAERKKQAQEEEARKLAERKAAELALKEKAAIERIAKEKAQRERKEAEQKAAALAAKQQADREMRAKAEAQRHAQAQRAAQQRAQGSQKKCDVCGKPIAGAGIGGLCQECLNNPLKALEKLLLGAIQGNEEAKKIKGYTKVKTLGKGGMGEVWLMENDKTKERVALKLMLPRFAGNKQSCDMFKREADVAQQLNHPNVVRVFEHGYENSTHFILMEYCDGGSLDHLIAKRGGKLDIDFATNIMMQILDGLIYTHTAEVTAKKSGVPVRVNGVVHRDFKPGNVFLSGSIARPVAKIADFGLAKAFEVAGYSGFTGMFEGARGTALYMPLQQVLNFRKSKPEVDVWAAAASYYHMLTGAVPKEFPPGKNPADCILNTSAVPIRTRNPKIPSRLARVIDAALVDSPNIGVTSAKELKTMIEGAL